MAKPAVPFKRPLTPCRLASRVVPGGYGRLPSGRRGVWRYAHRAAWEETHGPIPPGAHVHHECGEKACVNVEHLRLLSPRQHHALSRRCQHDPAEQYRRPDGRLRCRACAAEYRAANRERIAAYQRDYYRRRRDGEA